MIHGNENAVLSGRDSHSHHHHYRYVELSEREICFRGRRTIKWTSERASEQHESKFCSHRPNDDMTREANYERIQASLRSRSRGVPTTNARFLFFRVDVQPGRLTVARAREILSRNSLRASSSGKSAPRRLFANVSRNFCHSAEIGIESYHIAWYHIREHGVLRFVTDPTAQCHNVSFLHINAFAPLFYLGNCSLRGGISESDLWGKSEIAPLLTARMKWLRQIIHILEVGKRILFLLWRNSSYNACP